jgi:hypothetical protein
VYIQKEWNSIQKDMENLLKEVDTHVKDNSKIECLNSPGKKNCPE